MCDYEGTPLGTGWSSGLTVGDLTNLRTEGSRLISLHRNDVGGSELYTAAWVANAGSDQTEWDFLQSADADELRAAVDAGQGRLICIDSFRTGPPLFEGQFDEVRFTGVWVRNEGALHRTGDWASNLSVADIEGNTRRVEGAENRLISLTTYVQHGKRRYAAVWVANPPGAPYRNWDWHPSISFEDLRQRLEDFPGRLVSIDPYVENGELRFAAVWIDAGDQQARLWWWGVGTSADAISMDAELFCSYVIEARTLPNAPDLFVHFRHGFPRPDYAEGAELVSLAGTASLDSVADGDNDWGFSQSSTVNLELTNVTADPIDIAEADILRTYNGWFWAGWISEPVLQPRTAPDGSVIAPVLFGGQATSIQPGDHYSGSWVDNAPVGTTHFVARVRATNPTGQSQRTAHAIPIVRAGHDMPTFLYASVPVFLGFWANPLEIIPLWLDGKMVNWLLIGGMVTNWTADTLRLGGLYITVLTPAGKIIEDREANYSYFIAPDASVIPPSTSAHAELTGEFTYFVEGFPLPDDLDVSDGVIVRMTLNYKLSDGWCGAAQQLTEAKYVEPRTAVAPVKGEWSWGSGPPHLPPHNHSHVGERFCYDLGQGMKPIQPGQTPDAHKADNNSYICYGKPVYAVRSGEVRGCNFTAPENNGNLHDDFEQFNFVSLGHGGGPDFPERSTYQHLQPTAPDCPQHPGQPLQTGCEVTAGDVIGYVGNSGNSWAPHLHFGYTITDDTGRARRYPLQYRDLRTLDGDAVSGIPSQGVYLS